jgi:hypothetical protein
MARGITLDFDFSKAQTISDFFHDDSFVRLIVGPVGSSKTTAFCVEVMKRAMQQAPSPIDNVRYFKAAIVRNTMPELWRTTIETWTAVFREDQCGAMRRSAPVHHHIKIPPNQDTGEPGLDLLVDFFAMDKPDNVRALLSYEGTLIWFNEVREIPRSIVKAATDRAGRYPSMAKNSVMPTWFGVMGDTNPPDEDHWIYEFYCDLPENYKVYKQPPGVFEVKELEKEDGSIYWKSIDPRAPELLTDREDRIVKAGGRIWTANPYAENLENLPVAPGQTDVLGRGGYYLHRVSGKDYDWIRGYYQGDFGPIFDGKPVIPEFSRDVHVVDDLQPIEGAPILGGFDIGAGTLSNAAVIGQRHPRGPYIILDEVYPSDDGIGLVAFAQEVSYVLSSRFPDVQAESLGRFFGDPAGRTRDGLFEVTVFDHLSRMGLPVMEAPSNDPRLRIEAIKAPATRMAEGGRPCLLIHPRCKNLIKGLQGAWCFKRLQVSSSKERFREVPDKNEYSHVCDALGYMLLGSGEGNSLRGRTQGAGAPTGSIKAKGLKPKVFG